MPHLRIYVTWVILCACAVLCNMGWSNAEPQKEKEQSRLERALSLIQSDDLSERDRGIEMIESDYDELVSELSKMVDPETGDDYPRKSRHIACWLLGELRAVEGIPALMRALDADDLKVPFVSGQPVAEVAFPLGSLTRIGRPVMPHVVERLKKAESREGLGDLTLIAQIVLGHRDRAVRMLDGLIEESTSAENRKVLEWARDDLRQRKVDDEEPLY